MIQEIKINGDGLGPKLEQIFLEILAAIVKRCEAEK